ncbi:helix-turn-helix transcriptional regulator [Pseudonocardia nigra]|uniref:helix-turn-helix transcriptional regulator n=1 Tax=Pseudonocardia nigra TaxID=1921578 RepID=UPI003556F0B8
MKTAGHPIPVDAPDRTTEGPPTGDGRTREAVARLLMEQGPITAAAVAAALELSAPAVRRHLDALLADGEAEVRDAPRRGPRGRGRPARRYLLSDAGRARFGHGYDELAVAALHYVAEHGGELALRGFARSRVEKLLGAGAEQVAAAGTPHERAEALAGVLSSRGYAAQARAAGTGVQLCQHHCPVAHVAAEFPALCEAETEAFAELLGTHVQRLATIARGDAACTTHVPLDVPDARRKHDPTTTIPTGRQSE